jgi:hypothetical protein
MQRQRDVCGSRSAADGSEAAPVRAPLSQRRRQSDNVPPNCVTATATGILPCIISSLTRDACLARRCGLVRAAHVGVARKPAALTLNNATRCCLVPATTGTCE